MVDAGIGYSSLFIVWGSHGARSLASERWQAMSGEGRSCNSWWLVTIKWPGTASSTNSANTSLYVIPELYGTSRIWYSYIATRTSDLARATDHRRNMHPYVHTNPVCLWRTNEYFWIWIMITIRKPAALLQGFYSRNPHDSCTSTATHSNYPLVLTDTSWRENQVTVLPGVMWYSHSRIMVSCFYATIKLPAASFYCWWNRHHSVCPLERTSCLLYI